MGLTLYSELDCQGKSVVIKDKEVNLSKAGLTFNVKVSGDQVAVEIKIVKLICNLFTCKIDMRE